MSNYGYGDWSNSYEDESSEFNSSPESTNFYMSNYGKNSSNTNIQDYDFELSEDNDYYSSNKPSVSSKNPSINGSAATYLKNSDSSSMKKLVDPRGSQYTTQRSSLNDRAQQILTKNQELYSTLKKEEEEKEKNNDYKSLTDTFQDLLKDIDVSKYNLNDDSESLKDNIKTKSNSKLKKGYSDEVNYDDDDDFDISMDDSPRNSKPKFTSSNSSGNRGRRTSYDLENFHNSDSYLNSPSGQWNNTNMHSGINNSFVNYHSPGYDSVSDSFEISEADLEVGVLAKRKLSEKQLVRDSQVFVNQSIDHSIVKAKISDSPDVNVGKNP